MCQLGIIGSGEIFFLFERLTACKNDNQVEKGKIYMLIL